MAYIPYRNLLEALEIDPGTSLYISSNMFRMAIVAKRNGDAFTLDDFLDAVLDYMDLNRATILLPTYNFTAFTRDHLFDYRNTPGTVGVLGNAALRRKDFVRTWHPIHSLAAAGKDASYLAAMRNRNSFGEDGPFHYMKEQGVVHLMLDNDYSTSFTFLHYVETAEKVPFRFNKEFRGTYLDGQGVAAQTVIEYPCRYLNLHTAQHANDMGQILRQQGTATRKEINGLEFHMADLGRSYPYLAEDLTKNKAVHCYDFDIDRDRVYAGDFPKEETLMYAEQK